MQRAELETKRVPELRQMMVKRGMKWQLNEKKQSLIDRMMEVGIAVQPDAKRELQKPEPIREKEPPLVTEIPMDEMELKADLIIGTETPRATHIVIHAPEPVVFSDEARELAQQAILKAVERHMKCGMQVRFNEDSWHFKKGAKEDSGGYKIPLSAIVRCADKL